MKEQCVEVEQMDIFADRFIFSTLCAFIFPCCKVQSGSFTKLSSHTVQVRPVYVRTIAVKCLFAIMYKPETPQERATC